MRTLGVRDRRARRRVGGSQRGHRRWHFAEHWKQLLGLRAPSARAPTVWPGPTMPWCVKVFAAGQAVHHCTRPSAPLLVRRPASLHIGPWSPSGDPRYRRDSRLAQRNAPLGGVRSCCSSWWKPSNNSLSLLVVQRAVVPTYRLNAPVFAGTTQSRCKRESYGDGAQLRIGCR
jgi:hypothetical protein